MFFFLPVALQPVLGLVLLGVGLAIHSVILDVVGALVFVIGGVRFLGRRRNSGAGGIGGIGGIGGARGTGRNRGTGGVGR